MVGFIRRGGIGLHGHGGGDGLPCQRLHGADKQGGKNGKVNKPAHGTQSRNVQAALAKPKYRKSKKCRRRHTDQRRQICRGKLG